MTALVGAQWSPNQQAARARIVDAAAGLIGREGLSACTLRAVAEEAGLKKSTVHYYFEDANELLDLSVAKLFRRFAGSAADTVESLPGAAEALAFLVRLFMGRAGTPPPFREGMLWPEYTAHAWKRDAHHEIRQCLDIFRSVFETALRKSVPEEDATARASSVHDHLLGAMVRNMVQPIPQQEIAVAISAISGVQLDPDNC